MPALEPGDILMVRCSKSDCFVNLDPVHTHYYIATAQSISFEGMLHHFVYGVFEQNRVKKRWVIENETVFVQNSLDAHYKPKAKERIVAKLKDMYRRRAIWKKGEEQFVTWIRYGRRNLKFDSDSEPIPIKDYTNPPNAPDALSLELAEPLVQQLDQQQWTWLDLFCCCH